MFEWSITSRQSVESGMERVHGPRRLSPFDAEEKYVELGFEGDAGIPVQQLEMLERIRVAAGQTS